MTWLLDTCVISEAMRPRPEPRVLAWLEARRTDDLYLSVVSIGELKEGIERLPPGKRRHDLQSWLDDKLLVDFMDRTLELDIHTALVWGELRAEAMNRGAPPPVVDSLIAASAVRHGLTVVTRNVADFRSLKVKTLDPWA